MICLRYCFVCFVSLVLFRNSRFGSSSNNNNNNHNNHNHENKNKNNSSSNIRINISCPSEPSTRRTNQSEVPFFLDLIDTRRYAEFNLPTRLRLTNNSGGERLPGHRRSHSFVLKKTCQTTARGATNTTLEIVLIGKTATRAVPTQLLRSDHLHCIIRNARLIRCRHRYIRHPHRQQQQI